MKIVSFTFGDRFGFGRLDGDTVWPIVETDEFTRDLVSHLKRHAEGQPKFRLEGPVALSDVRLRPPVPNPGKTICVATNFHEPSNEGKAKGPYPLLFTRFADSLVGHGSDLCKPAGSDQYDFEGELAVIIGKPGFHIDESDAMAHVAGYACFNDGSVRDWQKHSTQFTAGKNVYRSGAFGPWMTTADDVPDLTALTLETRINGAVKQRIGLDKFIFTPAWLIAYISSFTPLAAGDVIATGTPSGFGSTRIPPEFLRVGDVVEIDLGPIGTLRNTVSDATQ